MEKRERNHSMQNGIYIFDILIKMHIILMWIYYICTYVQQLPFSDNYMDKRKN